MAHVQLERSGLWVPETIYDKVNTQKVIIENFNTLDEFVGNTNNRITDIRNAMKRLNGWKGYFSGNIDDYHTMDHIGYWTMSNSANTASGLPIGRASNETIILNVRGTAASNVNSGHVQELYYTKQNIVYRRYYSGTWTGWKYVCELANGNVNAWATSNTLTGNYIPKVTGNGQISESNIKLQSLRYRYRGYWDGSSLNDVTYDHVGTWYAHYSSGGIAQFPPNLPIARVSGEHIMIDIDITGESPSGSYIASEMVERITYLTQGRQFTRCKSGGTWSDWKSQVSITGGEILSFEYIPSCSGSGITNSVYKFEDLFIYRGTWNTSTTGGLSNLTADCCGVWSYHGEPGGDMPNLDGVMLVYKGLNNDLCVTIRDPRYNNMYMASKCYGAWSEWRRFSGVAFSGSYNDLLDKPTIPNSTTVSTSVTLTGREPNGTTQFVVSHNGLYISNLHMYEFSTTSGSHGTQYLNVRYTAILNNGTEIDHSTSQQQIYSGPGIDPKGFTAVYNNEYGRVDFTVYGSNSLPENIENLVYINDDRYNSAHRNVTYPYNSLGTEYIFVSLSKPSDIESGTPELYSIAVSNGNGTITNISVPTKTSALAIASANDIVNAAQIRMYGMLNGGKYTYNAQVTIENKTHTLTLTQTSTITDHSVVIYYHPNDEESNKLSIKIDESIGVTEPIATATLSGTAILIPAVPSDTTALTLYKEFTIIL